MMRRRSLLALPALALLGLTGRPASASPIDELAKKAAAAGPILWYESSPTEEMQPLIKAFEQRYPGVKLQHVRDTGGNAMAARVIQETQGGGRTADVGSNGPPILSQLARRGLLADVEWAGLGVDKKVIATPYALATAATAYVIIYNTQAVKQADAPGTFEALLDPRWKSRIGLWNRSEAQTSIAAVWGEAKTSEFIGKLKGQQPMLFASSFPMVQSLASGEIDIAWGAQHAVRPTLRKGGPVQFVVPDPLPVTTIYTFVTKAARNPEGAQLFAAWLTSPEGAKAYESATGRGNLLVDGTDYGTMAKGKTIAEIPLTRNDEYSRIYEAYNALLAK